MKKTIIAVGYVPVLVGLLAVGPLGFTSCKKKEDDVPPAPSAAPIPVPTPTPIAIATATERITITDVERAFDKMHSGEVLRSVVIL